MGLRYMPIIYALLASFSQCALSEDKDADIEKFVVKVNALLDAALSKQQELAEQMKTMEAGRINKSLKKDFELIESRTTKRIQWKSAAIKEKSLNDFRLRIAQLESDEAIVPTLEYATLEVGQIGKLPDLSINENGYSSTYKILQIIDADNALVSWNLIKMSQFADVQPKVTSKSFWLVAKTTGKVDGTVLELSGTYRVTGTKQYETAAGSNTVYVLAPFDSSIILADLRTSKTAKPKAAPEFRQWSDATNSFTVKAKLVKIVDGNVVLEKPDGKQITVPLDKLSGDDAKWLATNK